MKGPNFQQNTALNHKNKPEKSSLINVSTHQKQQNLFKFNL